MGCGRAEADASDGEVSGVGEITDTPQVAGVGFFEGFDEMVLVIKTCFDGDPGDGVSAFRQQRFGPVEASVDEPGSQTRAEASEILPAVFEFAVDIPGPA